MNGSKATRNGGSHPRAIPSAVIDRNREEEILLRRWLALDNEQLIDELDSDQAADRHLEMVLAGIREDKVYFDA